MGMIEKVTSAINIKEDIRDAIEAKGVDMATVTFGGFAEKIGEIETGIDPTDATAYPSQVVSGKTFYARDNSLHTGTMPYAVVSTTLTATTVTMGYNTSAVVVPVNGNYTGAKAALTDVGSGIHAQYVRYTGGTPVIRAGGVVNELHMSHDYGEEPFYYGTITNSGTIHQAFVEDDGTIVNTGYFGGVIEDLFMNNGVISGGTITGGCITGGTANVGTATGIKIEGGYLETYDAEDVTLAGSATVEIKSGGTASRIFIDTGNQSASLDIQSGASASVILAEPWYSGIIDNNGAVSYLVDTSGTDVNEDEVAAGKTFFSQNLPYARTGTAVIGGGMPSIPSSFTSLNLNQAYTAPSDGWIRYTIRYNWGMGQNSYLDVGARSYRFANVQGEDMDIGYITLTGIAPVYAGETFKLTAQGSTSASSVLEVAYI